MKNFFKGIGASLGYIAIYIVVTALVLIAGSIAYAVFLGVTAVKSNYALDSFFDSFNSFVYDSVILFTLVSGAVTLFIYWLIIIAGKKSVKARLDLIPVSFSNLWPIIPLGILFNLFISSLLDLLPIPEHLMQDYIESSSTLGNESTLILFLTVVLMAPVLEEVLFRGLVMKSLSRGMPFILALILQAIAFGILHGQIIWIFYATFLGIVLGIVKKRYVSLYPCILLHLVFNGWSFAMSSMYDILPESLLPNILLLSISTILIVFLGIVIFKKTKKVEFVEDIKSNENTLYIEETEHQAIYEQK